MVEVKEDITAFQNYLYAVCGLSVRQALGQMDERRPGLQHSDMVPFSGFLCLSPNQTTEDMNHVGSVRCLL